MKVLLVDDDSDLLDVTAYALRREGLNVIMATDGVQALQKWESENPDLVVLDVGLSRMNGFEVCHRIRQTGTTPVIMLTALADDDHVVQGFRQGADDYVTKPFSPRQLAMRIRAVWRRGAGAAQLEPAREITLDDLALDIESHQVRHGNLTVRLTPIEFRLLYILVMNAGRVVSGTRLVEYAWGYDGSDTSLLKTHISHIRIKLQLPRGKPGDIQAIPGVGYSLTRKYADAASEEDAEDVADRQELSASR